MSKKLMDIEIRDTQVCDCMCHIKGKSMLHFAACCEVSGQYVNVDGSVDYIVWGKALRESYNFRRSQGEIQ